MKKILFASAFALFGTFAMANEVNVELQENTVDITVELERECQAFDSVSECGGQFIACKEVGTSWNLMNLLIADFQLCELEQSMGL